MGAKAADQRGIGQQCVDMERHVGHADAIAPRGDCGMQVGQRLAIVQPCNLRHHTIEQVEHAIGLCHEGIKPTTPVHTLSGPVLVQHPSRTGARLLRR